MCGVGRYNENVSSLGQMGIDVTRRSTRRDGAGKRRGRDQKFSDLRQGWGRVESGLSQTSGKVERVVGEIGVASRGHSMEV